MSWESLGFYNRPLPVRTAFEMITAALKERRQRTKQYMPSPPYRLWDGLNNPDRGMLAWIRAAVSDIRNSVVSFRDPFQLTDRPPSPRLTADRVDELISYSLFKQNFAYLTRLSLQEPLDAMARALSLLYVVEYSGSFGVSLIREGHASISSWDAAGIEAAYQEAIDDAMAADVKCFSYSDILSDVVISRRTEAVNLYASEYYPPVLITPPEGVTHTGYLYPSLGGDPNSLFPEMGDLPPVPLGDIITIGGGGKVYKVFDNKVGEKSFFPPCPELDWAAKDYYSSRVRFTARYPTRCFYDFKYK